MNKKTIQVWDIAIRLFHWSLVATFAIAYLSGEEDSVIHIYSGYAVLGLVIFRIIWGFIGSKYARFRNFIYSPNKVITYLKSLATGTPEQYAGHNPAGGWMILALLMSLITTSITGLKVYGLEGFGPLADANVNISIIYPAHADSDEHYESGDEEENESEELWEEVHEFFANLTLLLIFIHVAGVILSSKLHKENLVKAMITGEKHRHRNQ